MAEDDEKLNKLAIEELLRETRRAAIRANDVGSSGWRKCPLPSTNKRFIRNTLLSTLSRPSSAKRPKIIVQDSPKNKRVKIEEKRHSEKDDKYTKKPKEKSSSREHQKPHPDKSKASSKQTENKSLKNRE